MNLKVLGVKIMGVDRVIKARRRLVMNHMWYLWYIAMGVILLMIMVDAGAIVWYLYRQCICHLPIDVECARLASEITYSEIIFRALRDMLIASVIMTSLMILGFRWVQSSSFDNMVKKAVKFEDGDSVSESDIEKESVSDPIIESDSVSESNTESVSEQNKDKEVE